MVDTVHFRIHDLRRHHAVLEFLHQKHVAGQSKFSKDVPIEDFGKKIFNAEYWWDWSTGNKVETAYRGHLPSHHYDVAFSVSWSRDCIDFNISIPKFLYRTNVFQFVPHYFDSDYDLIYGNSVDQRGKAAYDRLMKFFNTYFKTNFDDLVDWRFVQLFRVDLCFNMLFQSKEQALDYMKDLKRIKKKFSRESKVFTDGNFLGLYYVHNDYTFKVYHKGLEFKVHDKKELRHQGIDKARIETIQNFADRMVRYEVEFKTGMMDRIWKRNCFRRRSDKWKKAKKYYFQFSRAGCIIKNGQKLYRTPPVKDEKGREYSEGEIDSMKMNRMQFALVKYGQFFTNKTFHFFLKSDSNLRLSTKQALDLWDAEIPTGSFTYEQDQWFSKRLWDGMVDTFMIFMREFTVQYQEDIRYVIRRIDEKEDFKKGKAVEFYEYLKGKTGLPDAVLRRISLGKVKMLLKLLETYSFSDIKAQNFFPDRTFYLYKKVFVALGFSDYSPSRLAPKGDMSFTEYFWWVEEINTKLNFGNLLKTKF